MAGASNVSIRLFVGLPFQKMKPDTRRAFLENWSSACDTNPYLALPVEVEMPCGKKYMFETSWDIPVEDQPCECGDTKHYVVKWD